MVKYQSTRGSTKNLSFQDTVISGLATDKGLYLPDSTTLNNLSLLTQDDLSLYQLDNTKKPQNEE